MQLLDGDSNHSLASISDEKMLFLLLPTTSYIPFFTLPTKFSLFSFFSTQLGGKDGDDVDEMRERERKKE